MSKFKRYERYKDSGVEWIGEIPEHWDNKKISWIFKIIGSGTTPSTSNLEYYDGNVPWVNTGDLNDGYLYETSKMITDLALKDYPTLKFYPINTLLIAMYGATIGKLSITKIVTTTNQACCALAQPKNANIKFTFYWLLANRNHIIAMAYGGGQPNISQNLIKSLRISLPEKHEQNAIVNFLDQKTAEIDDLIADKEKLIELLQEKRQAIITEAVTKGLNPNARMKDSGIEWIGEIPEHWRLSKIKYESLINNKTLSESTDDDYEIDYIDISSVTSIGEIDGVQSLNFKDAPSRARRILSKGDTIVSTVRTYLKAIAFIENTQSNLICSTGFAVLTPLSKVVPKYLFYLMRSEKYVNEIVRRSVGVSYPAVNASDIGDLECALPDRDEQMYIVEYLDNCTTQINQLVNNIQAQIQKLKEYRQSLISEAVTGKIDVREFGSIREVI